MDSMIFLSSDNCAPAHPSIIQAIIEANNGFAPSYGSDTWTKNAQKLIQKVLGRQGQVFMIPTGTGANILSLKIALKRHESVLCTDIGHINFQESGAAESVIGCKLLGVPHVNGKITKENLLFCLNKELAVGKHATVPRLVSIAQSTEVGTVYNLAEMAELAKTCKDHGLLLHVDGSRIYNAAASLNIGLDEMMAALSCDILSLGGTKNGLLSAEAVVIFNPHLFDGSDHLHKQTLQLLSKMRYLSAQYLAFFKDDLWQKLAQNANDMAKEMSFIIKDVSGLTLNYPVETNQIFLSADDYWFSKMQEKVHCLPWDLTKRELRLIASWNTTKEDVLNLKKVLTK